MTPPETPPSAPPPRRGPPRIALIGAAVAVIAGVTVVFLGRSRSGSPPEPSPTTASTPQTAAPSTAGDTLQALPPAPGKPEALSVPTTPVSPAFWVDVYAPGKVREALGGNAWLKEQWQKPLGKGFVGSWAPLLATRGEDLGGGFKGALLDVLAGQLLAAPFRVMWYAGDQRSLTPAIIVPQPGDAAMAAFDSINATVRRNELEAKSCPGGTGEVPTEGFKLERWLVAEQALWAGRTQDRLVLSRHPATVLQGLCEGHLELEPPQGVDVELGFNPDALGREAQLLTHVMGASQGLRLQFAAEGHRLVGRGIAGPVSEEPRLDSAPLSDELLKLVPEETPVLLALQLKLPEQLDVASLKNFWAGTSKGGALRTRQVALVWTPRGDELKNTEVALLWGRPEDAEALARLFSGPNPLWAVTMCGHRVLTSQNDMISRLRQACEGKSPNMLNASAPVVQGLRERGSVAFGVNTGRLLGLLLADGYTSPRSVEEANSKQPPPPLPPELESARRDLETLPYIGLRGTVEGSRLVPGGFGS